MTAELPHTMGELNSRRNDGLQIRLLWGPDDGRVTVAVANTKTGEQFAFDVRDGDRALDAFHHPFAYTAWRGIETSVTPGPAALVDEVAA